MLTMILACACSVRHVASYCVTSFPGFSATKWLGSLGEKGRCRHHSVTITVQSREVGIIYESELTTVINLARSLTNVEFAEVCWF